MDAVLLLMLGAATLIGIRLLRGGQAERLAVVGKNDVEARSDVDGRVESGLLTGSEVQRRLGALREELERLEESQDVFAKGFHTLAALSAYRALEAEASRLGDDQRRGSVGVLEIEYVEGSSPRGEVLEF